MIAAWGMLVRKALLDSGRSPLMALAGECAGSLMGLTVYWFTAKAMGPALSFSGDYFTFVVVGETVLSLPLALWSGVSASVKNDALDGTLEIFLTLPAPASVIVAAQALALLPREAVRQGATWTVAALVFGLSVSPFRLAELLVLQVVSAPLFLGLGLLAAAALVWLGRGYATLAHGGTLLTVLAGTYFPLAVLPPKVVGWSRMASPFTWVLESARSLLVEGWHAVPLSLASAWVCLGLALTVLGCGALELSFARLRRRGEGLQFVR